MSLKDKVVIITGGSSGIGASIAERMTKEGAKVAIVGRNVSKLTIAAGNCQKLGRKPLVIKADLTDSDDVRRVISTTVKEYGKLDILVNNAGFGKTGSITDDGAMELFDEILKLDLRAVVELTHLAIPYLVKTKGNIINISSVAALRAHPQFWAYCVAKAGLDHFTRAIALELAPKGVRANTINPGPVKTDFFSNMGVEGAALDAFYDNMRVNTALKRVSEVGEISDMVLFVASAQAVGVTGSTFVVDNGYCILSNMVFDK